MSKRVAESQITKDDYDNDHDESNQTVDGTFSKANDTELKGRKIKQPKRRAANGSAPSNPFAAVSNPFAAASSAFGSVTKESTFAFKPFGEVESTKLSTSSSVPASDKSTLSKEPPAAPFSGFSFNQPKQSNISETDVVKPQLSARPSLPPPPTQPTPAIAGSTPVLPSQQAEDHSNTQKDYLKQLYALNTALEKNIKTQITLDPFVDLSPVFVKYNEYKAEICTKFSSVLTKDLPNVSTAKSSTGSLLKSTPSFGSSNMTSTPKPSNQFGIPSQTVPSTTDSKPMFSFDKPADSTRTKIASFSSVATADSKTGFSFNVAASPFQFKPANSDTVAGKADESTHTSTAAPPAGFSFKFGSSDGPSQQGSAGSNPAPFVFGGVPNSSVGGANSHSEEADDTVETEPTPQDVTLVQTGQGEEDDITVFSVRCKVFLSEPSGYKDLGAGLFKLNKHKETGKSRLLVRGDGLGKVILNAAVFKEMKMTIEGNKKNNIKFAVVDVAKDGEGDGKPKIVQYLLRVKTEDDATGLVKHVEDVKGQL